MKIESSVFTEPGTTGDFMYMMDQPVYDDTLFIFNDNVEFHNSNVRGRGNAVVRPFNRYRDASFPKLRSAGIPTGYMYGDRGFSALDVPTKTIIDAAVLEIQVILYKIHYDTVVYAGDKIKTVALEDGRVVPLLGTKLFVVDDAVLTYITREIWNLE